MKGRLPESCTPEALEMLSAGFTVDAAESPWEARETALNHCLDALPERSARLIRDRYHAGQPMEAMAAKAGLSMDALYQTLSRLRRQLRDCVQRRLELTLKSE
jgi:RNA polymerase sigma-70 factor (ECF subfamily)